MAKKLPVLLICLIVFGVVMSACGAGNSGSEEDDGQNARQAAGPKEKIKIEITQDGTGLPSPEDNDIEKTLSEKLDAEITLTAIQNFEDYMNQLKVRIAAGNYPDLMRLDLVTLKEFAQKGLLLDLTPYMDNELKEAKEFMGEELLVKGTVDGKQYAITRIPDVPFNSFWIRKDWLEALNLEVPTNLDELYEVAKAFTENDPDGNGKDDTYGFTGTEFSTFAPIFGAFGVGLPGSVYVRDGQTIDAYYDPGMKDALVYIKKLIADNLVDPSIMTNKGTMARDQAFQGKAGIIWIGWTDIGKVEFIEQYKTINPNAEWIQIEPPVGPDGLQYDSSFDASSPSRLYAIPKELEKHPEKLQKVFDLINYVSSREGNMLVMYGLEGRHYTLADDGKVVLTELMAKEGNYFHMYQITGRPNEEYLKTKFPAEEAYIQFALELPRIESFNSSIVPPDGFNAADAERYASEELVKFIYDKRPLEEYDDFLQTLETTFKYDLWLKEADKRAGEIGMK